MSGAPSRARQRRSGGRARGRLVDGEAQHEVLEALSRSEERYRAALAAKLDAHAFVDAVRDDSGTIVDFVYSDANEAALSYLGLTPR